MQASISISLMICIGGSIAYAIFLSRRFQRLKKEIEYMEKVTARISKTLESVESGSANLEKLEAIYEIKKIMAPAVNFVKDAISKDGRFFPHAYILTQEGEIKQVYGIPDFDTTAHDEKEVMEHLDFGLMKGALEGEYKAIAVILSARGLRHSEGKKKGRRIQETAIAKIKIEHESGIAQEIAMPYRWLGPGKLKISEAIIGNGKRKYFLDSGGGELRDESDSHS